MTNSPNNDPIEVRLRNYISHLSDVLKHFEENNRKFLEINIIMITISIALLSLLFNNLKDINHCFKIILVIPFGIYLSLSVCNILFNLCSNKTKYKTKEDLSCISRWCVKRKSSKPSKSLPPTLWHFNGTLPKLEKRKGFELDCNKFCHKIKHYAGMKKEEKISNKFIKDDIKDIFILYIYQENYYKIAIRTRKLTLWGFLFFSAYIIVVIFILFFFT